MSYLLAVCLALCWGTVFLTTKNIVHVLPPYWGTFYIVLAGLIFLTLFYAVQRKSVRIRADQLWRPWLIGFLLILLPFAARSWGQRFVDPTVGGLINGSVPMWAFVAGALLLKGADRFTWRRAIGVLTGLLGLIAIMGPSSLSVGKNLTALYGCLALLLMAWSYALGNVLTKKIMVDNNSVSLQANTFHQYLFSVVVLGITAYVLEPVPSLAVFSGKVVFSIICAGVFSSAIAFLLLIALLKRWGATRTSAISYFTPVIAMVGDMLLLHRFPSGNELIGLGLIFVSLFLIQKPVSEK